MSADHRVYLPAEMRARMREEIDAHIRTLGAKLNAIDPDRDDARDQLNAALAELDAIGNQWGERAEVNLALSDQIKQTRRIIDHARDQRVLINWRRAGWRG